MIDKLFLVKRSVRAKNIKEAMKNDGEIYSIEEVEDTVGQGEYTKIIGFDKINNERRSKK